MYIRMLKNIEKSIYYTELLLETVKIVFAIVKK